MGTTFREYVKHKAHQATNPRFSPDLPLSPIHLTSNEVHMILVIISDQLQNKWCPATFLKTM
jgi:hypothetical protein